MVRASEWVRALEEVALEEVALEPEVVGPGAVEGRAVLVESSD